MGDNVSITKWWPTPEHDEHILVFVARRPILRILEHGFFESISAVLSSRHHGKKVAGQNQLRCRGTLRLPPPCSHLTFAIPPWDPTRFRL